ncbi:MAG: hypothetical protein IPJ20_16895 [Flammeovirgaceae bacterium]|nr:hypothetical protein [Flammeovirgaceae bacterium]
MECNEGRLNEGVQDTGAAVTNDAAKAKGMTAWAQRNPPVGGRTVGAVCAVGCAIAQHGL